MNVHHFFGQMLRDNLTTYKFKILRHLHDNKCAYIFDSSDFDFDGSWLTDINLAVMIIKSIKSNKTGFRLNVICKTADFFQKCVIHSHRCETIEDLLRYLLNIEFKYVYSSNTLHEIPNDALTTCKSQLRTINTIHR